jgi:Tfx family DNA-binding protein
MTKDKTGTLTKIQIDVLKLRISGMTQEEIANRLGTTRQNISLVERRAKRNIQRAEDTLTAYRRLKTVASLTINPSTHLVDIPRMLIDAADKVGVRIRGDFTGVYRDLHQYAGGNIVGTKVVNPIQVDILRDGEVFVEPS